ncbi:MAG: hypothetical protein HOI47_17045 [Candidatus Scalindua sp.]|nr:hypothetical protein [Candidatus Scalindua sp.]MBT6228354.1 hypothetical protein [Candidatus Scalindua sp.]
MSKSRKNSRLSIIREILDKSGSYHDIIKQLNLSLSFPQSVERESGIIIA